MLIAEIFHSIQGEGELAGIPSVFIRLAGCNLRCRWCDTPYASWRPTGDKMSVAAVVATALRHPADHVVLTGGEPLVAAELWELAAELKAAGKHLTIETAATIPPDGIACDLASLSPKLGNSTPTATGTVPAAWRERHEQTRLQPAVIADWIDHYPYQLKFVIGSAADAAEIGELLAAIGRPIPASKILLMPEGTTAERLRETAPAALELCLRGGYRFCPRLQIELFGNRRGT